MTSPNGSNESTGPIDPSTPIEPTSPIDLTDSARPTDPIVRVDDADDPRLTDYTDLTDVELRRRREPAEGLFMAEGDKVIRRSLDTGHPLRSMLLTERWLDAMADVVALAAEAGAPVYVAAPEVVERVTGYHVHRGALASMQRKPLPEPAELLGAAAGSGDVTGPARIAVFEGFVDHANLGAAFRSAAALGIGAILLSPDCADPLYRRAVKVSMGAVFSVPYARFAEWPSGLGVLRDAGYRVLAMTPDERATPLDELPSEQFDRCALMLGSEGHGLSRRALDAADAWVRIPMAAGIDSLNVAAASAVVFYATRPKA
ncbi:TrmH family RNA methyltransferase [Yinghuangia sp. YIM S09857]|uniref:TrmH family RNA methyltransferase n=1 Tax=Yinghuangia sp. YIM S09857 TaxID=3436929 RepID=UPI003F538376